MVAPEVHLRTFRVGTLVPTRECFHHPKRVLLGLVLPGQIVYNAVVEILTFVAQGKSNKDIADLLSSSEQTIKNRLSAIYRKLKVANRAEAVTYAIQRGLISF